LERTLPASREVVFSAISNPVEVAKWWGPEGFTIGSADFEPRVGGRYRIQMQPPEGDAFYLRGEFRELKPPTVIAFTFEWEPADPDDVETLARIELLRRDPATEARLTQGTFKTEERLELHRDGWGESFDKLERLLAP
jgi:uncharacterized protein YndB with AHSA1/START domain